MSGRHRIMIVGVGKRQEGINKIGYGKWINDKIKHHGRRHSGTKEEHELRPTFLFKMLKYKSILRLKWICFFLIHTRIQGNSQVQNRKGPFP